MGSWATGKYALGICDYCGQQFAFNSLRKNWRGFKVCEADYEPKEPQLDPLKYNGDAIALFQPRPDRKSIMTVYVGIVGDTAFTTLVGMIPAPVNKPIVGVGQVGKVTVVTS